MFVIKPIMKMVSWAKKMVFVEGGSNPRKPRETYITFVELTHILRFKDHIRGARYAPRMCGNGSPALLSHVTLTKKTYI